MVPGMFREPTTVSRSDSPRWAARPHVVCILDVALIGKMEAVAFRLSDGRIVGAALADLLGADASPVTSITLVHDGHAVLIEQFSGDPVEIAWDSILHVVGGACPRAGEAVAPVAEQ